MQKLFSLLALICLLPVLPSCTSIPEAVTVRNSLIAAEPPGDYFIGRRYFVDTTRFWGYVRKPGQPWATAKLVVMNQSRVKVPDHLPEEPTDGGPAHGFDNNREYRITGGFTGRGIYDPNSNLTLPEFMLTGIELTNPSPGFLFSPRERYRADAISIYPPGGLKQWP